MAYSLISHVKGDGGGNSGFTSGAINTTGADLIVIVGSVYNATAYTVTGHLTDSASNVYTKLTQQDSTNRGIAIFYKVSPATSASHTFTVTQAGEWAFPAIAVTAWSGAYTSGAPIDQQNGANTGSAASLATGSVTPSQDNELVVAGWSSGATTSHSVSGYTISDQTFNTGSVAGGQAYLVQTTAGATNPSIAFGSTVEGAVAVATFKAAAGGGGGGVFGPLIGGRAFSLVQG